MATKADQTPLPPGMVLGPDGKPCKSCTSHLAWVKGMKKLNTTTNAAPSSSASSSASTTSSSSRATSVTSAAEQDDATEPIVIPPHCPPDVEQLGRSTWTFLHTAAAYYPEQPAPRQRMDMLSLLRALPTLYPCSHCATHLQENMKAYPPDSGVVGSRGPLGKWLCDRHNDVNRRLGKEVFDCAKTDERWKDGPKDGSCD